MKAANIRTGSHSRRRKTIRTPEVAVRIAIPPPDEIGPAPENFLASCIRKV
jgi:hypothetical protein